MKLIIGNKNLSSWSLRPWILLSYFEIPFEEELIWLDQPDTTSKISKYSKAGRVPILIDGESVIWDSLAIAEYLNERFPEKKMWPTNPSLRAEARSISCEMHSGFQNMRTVMTHNLQKTLTSFDPGPAALDIRRVKEIWTEALKKSGGPFLYGDFSIADAMYTPVVNRFITYAVECDLKREARLIAYMQNIRQIPAHKKWIEDALKEPAKNAH